MKIEVGFSKPVGFAPEGWLVMWLERTSFSHAYVRIYLPQYDRSVVYQATGTQVNFQNEEDFKADHTQVEAYEFEIDELDHQRIMQWAIDNNGAAYSYLEALGLGIKRILKRMGIRIKNPFAKDKEYVCCTLVAEAIHWAGIVALNNPDEIDLVALNRIVKNLYKLRNP